MSRRNLSWLIFLLVASGAGVSHAAGPDLHRAPDLDRAPDLHRAPDLDRAPDLHRAETRSEEQTQIVVYDQETLECLFQDDLGTMELDLKVEGEWVMTDGVIVDELSAEDTTREVVAQFQPESGYEHRMRFRPEGAGWSAWTGWTSGRIVHEMPVPGAGQSTSDELEAEMRPALSATPIRSHGYIRIKKLNSGG